MGKLWAIYDLAREGGWAFSLIKIKSHKLEPNADTESIDLEEMPYEYRLGNSYADYWADVAAKTVACGTVFCPLLPIGLLKRALC